jgi:uncharacterized C2H2 Zn-finger protein
MHVMYFNCPGCQQVFERHLDYEDRKLMCPTCGCKFRLADDAVVMVQPPTKPVPPPPKDKS